MTQSHTRRWVDVTERAIYLRSIPVAAELPQKVLHAVANSFVDREFEVGAKLLTAGKPVRALHLVTEGKLALISNGKRLSEILPPQSVGFLNILSRSDATYDAVVEEPTRTLELVTERFYELLEDQYPLLVATLRYFAQRLLYEMQELPQEMLGLPPSPIAIQIPERALDLVEKVFFLRCMSAFKRTNLSALAALAENMEEVRVPPGTRFFAVGEASAWSLFVIRGTVSCETADGRAFSYGPGTVVGGTESLAGKPRWYEALAQTDIVALKGRGDHLVDLMEDDFELGSDLACALATGLQGLLAMKAAKGQSTFGVQRDVSKLGAVPVGA